MEIVIREIHKNKKKIRTFATKINGTGFSFEVERSANYDNRTIEALAKNYIFSEMEVVIK